MKTTKRAVETIKVGDVIMPPSREVSLWMRRNAAQRGLNDDSLFLTVTEIQEGQQDAVGRWLQIRGEHTQEWNADKARSYPFTFKARPATPWIIIESTNA